MNQFSRREFLKFGAGALAFLRELSIPREALAKLEELLSHREFIGDFKIYPQTRLKRNIGDIPTNFDIGSSLGNTIKIISN